MSIDIDISAGEIPLVELEDLNGDELSDVVIVQNDVLRYAINRNGTAFEPWQTLRAIDGQPLPTRAAGTRVLFADMNGNGSTDVVWAGPQSPLQRGETVSLDRERVRIIVAGDRTVLEAAFWFSNDGAARTVRMGFPWAAGEGEPLDFSVKVDGKPVEDIESLPGAKADPKGKRGGRAKHEFRGDYAGWKVFGLLRPVFRGRSQPLVQPIAPCTSGMPP